MDRDSGDSAVVASEPGEIRRLASFLRDFELFAGLEDDDLRRLARLLHELFVATEEVLFRHGDPSDAFFLVREGAVALFRDEVGKPLQLLARRRAGEHFGELGLFDASERHATARATEPSRVLKVGREAFLAFLDDHPDVALRLHIAAARRHSENVAAVLGMGPRDEVRVRLSRRAVLLHAGAEPRMVVLENLSKGGLSLRGAPVAWRPPVEIAFTLELDGEPLEVQGRVSWRSGDLLGIAFTDRSADHEEQVQGVLRRLLHPAEG